MTETDKPARHRFSKPSWFVAFELWIGRNIPLSPNSLSSIKLFLVTPLFIASLSPDGPFGASRLWPVGFFFCFSLFDYLDGLVARTTGRDSPFGRIYDRVSDYPILAAVAWFCLDVLPASLLAAKLALDFVLLILFALKRGVIQNRLRTSIGYTTLLVLLLLSLGFESRFVTTDLAKGLLVVNIFTNALVVLRRLRLLQKRFIADSLSAANLLCGCFGMYMAYLGRIDVSIVFLLLGAGFDGLDGAAARKFGSTRWGVYSDDIADAVSYGIAPGVAIMLHFRTLESVSGDWAGNFSMEGMVIGSIYIIFTISRLVFFTLSKSSSDPDYFRGVPSTIGGIIALTSAYLFKEYPALLGLMVGVACVLMVSFDTQYRHLGRALADHRNILRVSPVLLTLLLVYGALFERTLPIALILVLSLGYGILPVFRHFRRILAVVCLISAATLSSIAIQPRAAVWAAEKIKSDRPAHWAQPMKAVGVPNFHKVSEGVYRGGQPTRAGFENLEKLGIKSIINLRHYHSDTRLLAGRQFIYFEIPIHTMRPTRAAYQKALDILYDEKNHPVFIHCKHGSDRTGTAVALYRITAQNRAKDEAIDEMVNGGFGFHKIVWTLVRFIREY